MGWIKLYREIMDSATFRRLTAIQKLIAIYIILFANHKDGIWFDQFKGASVAIKRGQLITSRKKIVEDWFQNDRSVTEQIVRTALAKLKKLGFITIESTNWYTLITVVNYEVYQGDASITNQPVNQDLTDGQPALNHGLTINKNEKNDKNEKKKRVSQTASMLSGKDLINNKDMYLAQFNDFWSLYPSKRGKSIALKKWMFLAPTMDFQKVMAGTRAYIDFCKVTDRPYKDGSTFINQSCWEDDWLIEPRPNIYPVKHSGNSSGKRPTPKDESPYDYPPDFIAGGIYANS